MPSGNVVHVTYTVKIDWDFAGGVGTPDFTGTYDNVSAYHRDIPSIQKGISDPMGVIADVGKMTLMLDNRDRRFSPEYTSSPIYGKMLPGKPILVTATEGATTWTVFYGYVDDFTPTTGRYKERACKVTASDLMAKLQKPKVALPLQQNITSDQLIKHVLNTVLRAAVATDTITIAVGNVANNDFIQVVGSQGTYKLTYKTTLSGGADEILIGASNTATASNTAAAINRGAGAGTTYASNMTQQTEFTATVASNVVTVSSTVRGAFANAWAFTKSGANITLGGANFSGGADAPSYPGTALQAGKVTFDYAADGWVDDDSGPNGIDALEQTTKSELGLFWIARDGTPTYKNRDFLFLQPVTAATLTLNSEQQEIDGRLSSERVANRVAVTYLPRATLASGVVAKSNSVVAVPGQTGLTERYNPTQALVTVAGDKVVTLPFIDPATGQPMGAKSITTPLTPTTDFTVNEAADGSAVDYTNNANIGFSLAIEGSNCKITCKNSALGPLFVTKLQVRGVGIVKYNKSTAYAEDATSQAAYDRIDLTIDIPFSSATVDNLAASYAAYLLSRYKDPKYRLESITFRDNNKIGGVNFYSIEIGNIITFTDYQTGLSGQRYLITGIRASDLRERRPGSFTFYVRRLDDVTYWILQDATYGALGTTTRLGV